MEETEEQLVCGIRPVIEALKAGRTFEKVLVSSTSKSPQLQELIFELRKQDVRHQYVPIQKLNKLYKGNHQGVVGYASIVPKVDLYEFLNLELAKGTLLRLLILDHLTDVRNIGALARSALALGFQAIIVPEKGSVLIHAGAIKSSAGALMKIPLIQVSSLPAAMKDIRLHGIQISGISEKAAKTIAEIPKDGPLALILGSEDLGIRKEHLKYCEDTYRIPMNSEIGSLNVSVAGALAMYEISKPN